MTNKDFDAFRHQPPHIRAFLLIATLDAKAFSVQNFSDGAHTNSTDAHDVYRGKV